MISVVIPAFNEENTIVAVTKHILENHKNLKLPIFRRVVRAGKKICS